MFELFLKNVSYSHQGSIYFIKNAVKTVNILFSLKCNLSMYTEKKD